MTRAIPYNSLWFGTTVWVCVTGLILYVTGWVLEQDFLFAYDSTSTKATVVNKFTRITKGRHGSQSVNCYLDYEYSVNDSIVHCRGGVEAHTYQELTVGDRFPVIYETGNPGSNRIELSAETGRVEFLTWMTIGISLFLLIGGSLMLRRFIRQNRAQRWLVSNGLQCMGVVTSVSYELTGKSRTIKRWYLNFEFRDNLGRVIAGRTWFLPYGAEDKWQAGLPIRVYYDPNDSSRFTVRLDPRDSSGAGLRPNILT